MGTKKISELTESQTFEGLYTIGVDRQGNSVKISLDELKDNAEVLAAAQAILEQIQQYGSVKRPTAIQVSSPMRLIVGGHPMYVHVETEPADADRNFIFLKATGRDSVRPDGLVTPSNAAGITKAYVIPADNTSLIEEVEIITGNTNIMILTDELRIVGRDSLRLTL